MADVAQQQTPLPGSLQHIFAGTGPEDSDRRYTGKAKQPPPSLSIVLGFLEVRVDGQALVGRL